MGDPFHCVKNNSREHFREPSCPRWCFPFPLGRYQFVFKLRLTFDVAPAQSSAWPTLIDLWNRLLKILWRCLNKLLTSRRFVFLMTLYWAIPRVSFINIVLVRLVIRPATGPYLYLKVTPNKTNFVDAPLCVCHHLLVQHRDLA